MSCDPLDVSTGENINATYSDDNRYVNSHMFVTCENNTVFVNNETTYNMTCTAQGLMAEFQGPINYTICYSEFIDKDLFLLSDQNKMVK